MGTLTYSPLSGGWLSGRWRRDSASAPASSARPSVRFDMTSPANQRKLDIVEELAQQAQQPGLTLIELAIAFVINHPGVTSAIVGPRTMDQLESYLPAADITLATDMLDRIDQLDRALPLLLPRTWHLPSIPERCTSARPSRFTTLGH